MLTNRIHTLLRALARWLAWLPGRKRGKRAFKRFVLDDISDEFDYAEARRISDYLIAKFSVPQVFVFHAPTPPSEQAHAGATWDWRQDAPPDEGEE